MEKFNFKNIIDFISKIPAIKSPIATGSDQNLWWIKFQIDINHPLAWHVVQELGHILNYLSIEEKLPTIFYPVSPPPYLNGTPEDFLSWVIESEDENFTLENLKEWLEGRLPKPVEDENEWVLEEE